MLSPSILSLYVCHQRIIENIEPRSLFSQKSSSSPILYIVVAGGNGDNESFTSSKYDNDEPQDTNDDYSYKYETRDRSGSTYSLQEEGEGDNNCTNMDKYGVSESTTKNNTGGSLYDHVFSGRLGVDDSEKKN